MVDVDLPFLVEEAWVVFDILGNLGLKFSRICEKTHRHVWYKSKTTGLHKKVGKIVDYSYICIMNTADRFLSVKNLFEMNKVMQQTHVFKICFYNK